MESLAFEIKKQNGGKIPVMGFTQDYYTLWFRSSPVISNYNQTIIFSYVQNLSMDYREACRKMQEKFKDDYEIDLELRSDSSFSISKDIREELIPCDCFSFGKLQGVRFSDSDDIWQLNRAMKESKTEERQYNAKKRLIELGELKEFEGQFLVQGDIDDILKKRMLKMGNGHHFSDGQRVKCELKELESFSFDGSYGRVFVVTYISTDSKIFKYMGSSPISISRCDFIKVQFTIKHSEYNGEKETKIQRLKIC